MPFPLVVDEVDIDAPPLAIPVHPTPLPVQAKVLGTGTPPNAPGMETVPVWVDVSPAERVRLEAKLSVEPAVDSGRETLAAGPATLTFTSFNGAGWRMLVTKEFRSTPAIKEEPELSPAASFVRGDAGVVGGAIAGPSGAELAML